VNTIVVPQRGRGIQIPAGFPDLESFCLWASSAEYPESGWYSYLQGKFWVDPSMERESHNQIKGEFAAVLGSLVKAARLGRYYHDRMGLSNTEADLGTEPDGMFVSFESFRSERVQRVNGGEEDPLWLEGTPDMVLEVVSLTSVHKDREVLPELYWLAGIPEYWLVDPLGDKLQFDVLRHTTKGYVTTRKQAGWVKSAVFGKAFRLTQKQGPDGYREFLLEVR
jgi:Uma2 family endonuclease